MDDHSCHILVFNQATQANSVWSSLRSRRNEYWRWLQLHAGEETASSAYINVSREQFKSSLKTWLFVQAYS